jgi:hypothetical protein
VAEDLTERSAAPPAERSLFRRRRIPSWASVLAVAWIGLAAFLYLLPSLLHGASLGSLDILESWTLTGIKGVQAHDPISGDQVQAFIPWAAMSWKQVHQGHFPLWNPYSGFGLPLFGNFQSAPLALPNLVSYLGPERLVFTVQVYLKLVIAGTGVLWMGRRLGLGWLAATFGGTAFMLSGALTGWLGWPMSGTMAWLGWAVGATLLIVRGERRRLHAAGLAVVVAFVWYAGHPETAAIVLAVTGLVALVALAHRAWRRPRDAGVGLLALAGAAVLGFLLSAPLLLPGIGIIRDANRGQILGHPESPRSALDLLFATYHGLPTRDSLFFGPNNYFEIASYVGFVVVVLAGLALLVRWREPAVQGLFLVGLICAALAYWPRVTLELDRLPLVKSVQWTRSVIALDFCLAGLGALGLQALVEQAPRAYVRRVFGALSVVAGAALLAFWMVHVDSRTQAAKAAIQAHSFIWPALEVAGLLAVAVALEVWAWRRGGGSPGRRHGRSGGPIVPLAGAGVLFAASSAFLLTATPRLMSSSHRFFAVTPQVAQLVRDTGPGARIGFARCRSIISIPGEGILVEANDAYGISEVTAYDGIVPRSYFRAYFAYIHQPVPRQTGFGQWCPSMSNAQVARHFGVPFVLTSGSPQPPGTVPVDVVGGESLYRVPGAGLVTLEPAGAAPDRADATVAAVDESDPATLRTTIDAPVRSDVYIRVTNYPGWHATLDGHGLALRNWGGVFLEATVPAGRHDLAVTYRPGSFTTGVWLAVGAGVLIVGLLAWPALVALGGGVARPAMARVRRASGRRSRPGGSQL